MPSSTLVNLPGISSASSLLLPWAPLSCTPSWLGDSPEDATSVPFRPYISMRYPLPTEGLLATWTEATPPPANLPLTRMLSGEVTSTSWLVSFSNHCLAWLLTTVETLLKSPTTNRKASIVWPQEMVNVFAPNSTSFCQVRSEVRSRVPPSIRLTWHDITSPT